MRLLERGNRGRIPELIPIRFGRMVKTPFTFYRGAALNMAADLAGTPVTGLRVQACGDCHLLNFGAYASPERRLLFDINDLDETLPAPWEWDVKRLAASVVLACRNNGFSKREARDAVLACVRSYRERMAEYSEMPVLEMWYVSLDIEEIIRTFKDKEAAGRGLKRIAAARGRKVLEHDFPKLAAIAGEAPTIRDNPPLIYHLKGKDARDLDTRARGAFAGYRESLSDDRRVLLDRYEIKDFAIKVVGVGSVGTFCAIALLMASETDPLFLQIKEARPSVLEAYAGKSIYPNDGQRIVAGYRLIQAASDIFLGWTKGKTRPALLRASAQGHEAWSSTRTVHSELHGRVCRGLRVGAGAVARALRRARHNQRLPRHAAIASTKPSRRSPPPTPIKASATTRS